MEEDAFDRDLELRDLYAVIKHLRFMLPRTLRP